MNAFARADEGQAIVIVGLAMVVLMGALALAIDWGHGYTARRAIQSEVDAATLAAGRRVATTYTVSGGSGAYEATLEDVCDEVARRTSAITGTTTVSLFSMAQSGDPLSWQTITTNGCGAGAGVAIAPDAIFVRVSASMTYRSLFAVASGQTITTGATARVRLASATPIRQLQLPPLPPGENYLPGVGVSGLTSAPNVAIWPIALKFDPTLLAGTSCGEYCDDPSRLVTLWRQGTGPGLTADFRLITFAHHSVREAPLVHQITTESDYRGTTHGEQGHPSLPPLANVSDPTICSDASWDTKGASTMSEAADCDVPNWFYYGFGGSIGIGTYWADPDWQPYLNAGLAPTELASPLSSSRASCGAATYFVMPSCAAGATMVGDWAETVTANAGDPTRNMADRMLEFIARYGRDDARSAALGKSVVVQVPVWDCAERFDGAQPAGSRWSLIAGPGGDCSLIAPGTSVGRVHILTSVPFTFYENLIHWSGPNVTIQAYWGDAFGDAGACAIDPTPSSCALNPLMNSAFLVADE